VAQEQPDTTPGAPPVCPGERGDAVGAEDGHLFQVHDELAQVALVGPGVQAELEQRRGGGVHLTDDLDHNAAGGVTGEDGHGQQLAGVGGVRQDGHDEHRSAPRVGGSGRGPLSSPAGR